MALSRKAKVWLTIVCIPVLLVIVVAIGLKLYFTDERLKALIVPRIEETLQRKVTVDHVALAFFPNIGVEIEGLVLANQPGFSNQPLFSLERLSLNVKLFELLKRRIEITKLILTKPSILLEIDERGKTNYATKGAARPASNEEPAGSRGAAAGTAVLLSDFSIVNGQLSFLDRQSNAATRLQGIAATMSMEMDPNSGDVRIVSQGVIDRLSYGSLVQELVSDLQVVTTETLHFDRQRDVLVVDKGEGSVNSLPLIVKGQVTNVTKGPIVDLRLESENLSVEKLLNLTPKEYAEKMKGVTGQGTARATVVVQGLYSDSTFPEIRGEIATNNASLQYPKIPKPITDISLIANFTRSTAVQEFNLAKCTAKLGNNPLSMVMKVVSFDDPALTMTIDGSMNLAEVKDFYPLDPGTELGGSLKAKVNIAGKVSKPDAMQASGTMDFRNVVARTPSSKNPIQQLNGTIVFNNQVLESKKLSMVIGRSDLVLAFTMRDYLSMMATGKDARKPVASMTLTSNRLYTTDIMASESAGGSGSPSTTSTGTSSSSATAQAPAKKAAMPLPNVDMNIAASIGTLTMERFEMKNVKGNIKVSNGLIALQNFSTNMFDGSITSVGSVNLQNPSRPTFDLKLDMSGLQANPMLSTFTSFGRRLFGNLDMNIAISGAMDDTLGLVPSSLNATGKVGIANGKLSGFKVNQAVASMLKLPDLEEVNFKDWGNSFTIKDGRVNISGLKITALGADYGVEGSQGLDGTMDFRMAMLLSDAASAKVSVPGFLGEAVTALKEPDGRMKLDFLVGGTAEKPAVSLDTKALQARATEFAKSKFDAEKQKLGDEAKKKAGELLKGLFKKK
jgi:uncharacterized protein involved in outer membrane biogenesis